MTNMQMSPFHDKFSLIIMPRSRIECNVFPHSFALQLDILPRTTLYRRTPCRALIYSTDMLLLLLLLLTFAAAAAAVVVVIDRVMC